MCYNFIGCTCKKKKFHTLNENYTIVKFILFIIVTIIYYITTFICYYLFGLT